MPHKRKAWIQKRVKINGKWCSRPAEQVKSITGVYVVCHWENGRLVRHPVGTDLRKAEHERNRQNIILNARAAGISTVATDARHSLSGAISDYIAHLRSLTTLIALETLTLASGHWLSGWRSTCACRP